MIKITIAASVFALAMPAMAQETSPTTWRDPQTRCVYFKVRDALSLRYRRDGTPDCASVKRDVPNAAITRTDFQQLARSVEALRRDIGGIRRAVANVSRDLENISRQLFERRDR